MRVEPSREDFIALAKGGDGQRPGSMPVWTEVLADVETPVAVYAKLAGDTPTFLLESAEHGESWGRYSFVGTDPFLVLRSRDGEVTWEGTPPAAALGAKGGLDALARATEALRAPTGLVALPLHGGAVGVVGYDAIREIEDIPASGVDDLGLDDVLMLFPRHVVGLDHLRQVLTCITNVVIPPDADDEVLGRLHGDAVAATLALVARLDQPSRTRQLPPPGTHELGEVQGNMTPEQYRDAVRSVKEHIRAGDSFQTVPSQRFAVPTSAEALDIYRVLRVINPSPYLFLFDFGTHHVIGSSPETLVKVLGEHVETWPIAGTRPRGATAQQDEAHAEDLLADDKERAEHVMLVDLARNDLGRVCQIGTVRVGDFMMVRRYSHVMHIASTVLGRLRPELGPVDVLRAVFPAGTVSGAPKVRAMQIIDALEPTRRGVYAGAAGYVDFAGNLDTCIALRTMVLKEQVAYVQAGAGVVADSDPEAEQLETRNKAHALLSAVAAAEAMLEQG
jgi:anthranilate synthase component 1